MSSSTAQARWTPYNICENVCQWLAADRWFPPSTPETNKTNHHAWNIVESSIKNHNKPNQMNVWYGYHAEEISID